MRDMFGIERFAGRGCRPFGARWETCAPSSQGLTPLAIGCRPFGTRPEFRLGTEVRVPRRACVQAI